jgi:hypothetical protein
LQGDYPQYEEFLDGRESSFDGEFFEKEDDTFEDDKLDDFLGWPPEMLFMPQQHRRGLHQRKTTHEHAESSAMRERAEYCGEGGGWSSLRRALQSAGEERTAKTQGGAGGRLSCLEREWADPGLHIEGTGGEKVEPGEGMLG